jgi:hypothetical protein
LRPRLTKFEVQGLTVGIAFTLARAFNLIMVFHSVALAGVLIIGIALVLSSLLGKLPG